MESINLKPGGIWKVLNLNFSFYFSFACKYVFLFRYIPILAYFSHFKADFSPDSKLIARLFYIKYL